jgi:hypothetical protein
VCPELSLELGEGKVLYEDASIVAVVEHLYPDTVHVVSRTAVWRQTYVPPFRTRVRGM